MRLSKNQHVSIVKFCDFPIFENYNSLIYQYVILSMRKSYCLFLGKQMLRMFRVFFV
jgi:hypothetical protein